ncbi:MAG: phosphoribosylformylglycinamidine synthase subunit PurS [Pseudomonadota bacterium]|nr:phosphoribosylformylglycinamidine synthase subunit PurS [Pseudomonadota bacterium]MEC9391907.1 phosphoribosylformylglycinamidine synthase subunit PurS [Pseudomonadota bacterium]MEC9458400.1 phosphoribosylformylglycinamidine synthase subunit PurS [Pseudomonadota bacterium]MEC9481580.1 phosphoribosylformylglycinamidine synthase subunit PurS [Pseudomonadota bacterium]|tara:strand:+ start:1054 stop:1299 length:246 start_codon:yes stop_codon:yes gene_type:complete
MKINIKIMPKSGVLDPQGKAIENSLKQLGFNQTGTVRQGKLIEIDLQEKEEEAIKIVDEMCQKLLVNLIIEDYEIIANKED